MTKSWPSLSFYWPPGTLPIISLRGTIFKRTTRTSSAHGHNSAHSNALHYTTSPLRRTIQVEGIFHRNTFARNHHTLSFWSDRRIIIGKIGCYMIGLIPLKWTRKGIKTNNVGNTIRLELIYSCITKKCRVDFLAR